MYVNDTGVKKVKVECKYSYQEPLLLSVHARFDKARTPTKDSEGWHEMDYNLFTGRSTESVGSSQG